MRITEARTAAEVFRNEVECDPDTLAISAVTLKTAQGPVNLVRFRMGGKEIYHRPEDAREIAKAILACADS